MHASCMLAAGTLLASFNLAGSQPSLPAGPASARPAAPRAANAPPLVAVTQDRNFRIAPPYSDDPAPFTEKPGVP